MQISPEAPCSKDSSTCTGHLAPTCTLFYSHLMYYPHQAAPGSNKVLVPALTMLLVRGNARDQDRTDAIQTPVGVGSAGP